MTESGKLGFIGGMELDTTKGKIAGFEEAAKYVAEQEGKTVELLNVPYANSFSDAPKGKEFATELISQGLTCSSATPPPLTPAPARPSMPPTPLPVP